jgi:hypothetical protein
MDSAPTSANARAMFVPITMLTMPKRMASSTIVATNDAACARLLRCVR